MVKILQMNLTTQATSNAKSGTEVVTNSTKEGQQNPIAFAALVDMNLIGSQSVKLGEATAIVDSVWDDFSNETEEKMDDVPDHESTLFDPDVALDTAVIVADNGEADQLDRKELPIAGASLMDSPAPLLSTETLNIPSNPTLGRLKSQPIGVPVSTETTKLPLGHVQDFISEPGEATHPDLSVGASGDNSGSPKSSDTPLSYNQVNPASRETSSVLQIDPPSLKQSHEALRTAQNAASVDGPQVQYIQHNANDGSVLRRIPTTIFTQYGMQIAQDSSLHIQEKGQINHSPAPMVTTSPTPETLRYTISTLIAPPNQTLDKLSMQPKGRADQIRDVDLKNGLNPSLQSETNPKLNNASTVIQTASPSHSSQIEARQIARQLAAHLGTQKEKTTVIRLNPEDLGHVRMILRTNDTGLVLAISAERPETAEAMRRNVDVLAQEFASLGFETLDFQFDGQAQERDQEKTTGSLLSDNADLPESLDHAPPKNTAPDGHLDMRI